VEITPDFGHAFSSSKMLDVLRPVRMLCTNDHSLYEIMLGAAPYSERIMHEHTCAFSIALLQPCMIYALRNDVMTSVPPSAQIIQDLDDLGTVKKTLTFNPKNNAEFDPFSSRISTQKT
jgi:hypothetical protein